MTTTLLALVHGPMGILVVAALGLVAMASALIASAAWRLSRPPKVNSPQDWLLPVSLAALVVFVNCGAASIWAATEWTLLGPSPLWAWRTAVGVLLPGALLGALYAWRCRAAAARASRGP